MSRPGDPPVDPRGVRFSAAVTTVVLALVLLSESGWLLAAQGVVFALGAFAGLRFSPYSVLYRALVAPRLSPPSEREAAAPVRFSQTVGFVFAAVGVVGFFTGLTTLGIVATAFALAAAFLNAAFGFCLGCEMYGLIARFRNTDNQQGATA
jgi:membrane associated rhomboid family serine protease